jgi:hypothetical protein
MRVFLTNPELETDEGKHLLELTVRIASDGKLELAEIKELRRWLLSNKENQRLPAIAYLHDIMSRITADGVIDRDELIELHLAIERVIPTSHRTPIVQARKKREAARRDRLREALRIEREKAKEEQKRLREDEYACKMRLRHAFAKVAGVTFPNDDGSERQRIIKNCKVGEPLVLRHDAYNEYSLFATQVLRENGEQLGHAPEYLAERICQEVESGFRSAGVLKNVTGGTSDKPTRGVNFIALFFAPDVTTEELRQYCTRVLTLEASDRAAPIEAPYDLASEQLRRPSNPWWKFW